MGSIIINQKEHTFERSRYRVDFHLAVMEESALDKPDNPHDPNAVAVFFEDHKLGYVPSGKNDQLNQML
ncbi:HIRAN domain-containing protein [Candidatus Enterococcus ferrettii]|uniref:HIRAN domain-containing protein n=1 Tax=Candidatus Enterococcus ferrettii TaxID=2815324 RepID=A0ABV0EUF4_9ENTE|nr:HIRAN domain-containing protein [Enterococcus sp. 665A]